MALKPLPIGISTLSKILENDMVYVDKTEFVHRLTATAGAYFLSRPRRFGKSLFLDTLKSLFEGREELFRGLYIHDKWDWKKKYPVIKVDFAGGTLRSREELDAKLEANLRRHQELFGIELLEEGIANQLNELILKTNRKFGSSVVLLIDEYDKPLLDNIDNPEASRELRDGLKNFYSVIKEQDSNLQFVFLTGVSKFSKVSIFSGINNLKDITLSPEFAAICGYTESDLDKNFGDHLEGADRARLKQWYNGYNFLGEPVYNPFDILLFISDRFLFRNYWIETGTPGFLVKMFRQRRYFLPDLENIEAGEELISSFELDNIQPATLLFQTGYLTIKGVSTSFGQIVYKLGFPNFEVKTSFTSYLITAYTDLSEEKFRHQKAVYESLRNADPPALESALGRLFAGIPWRNFTNNDIADFEGYYASVLYAFFSAVDCTVIPEDTSNHGQADLTVLLGDNAYVMEIKVAANLDPAAGNPALAQVRERGYAEKYRGRANCRVFELGLIFDPGKRNLSGFAWTEV